MVTFFATPKPFRGHIGLIQRNAIQSWRQLRPACQVLLFGTEEGAAEAAREFDIQHIPSVARTEHGTPLLNSLLDETRARALHPTLCYINCDIVLVDDFLTALNTITASPDRFLMVGQCWNLNLTTPLPFGDSNWAGDLRRLIKAEGQLRGRKAIDYFAFSRNLYENLPPFAIGRIAYDNWLIWKALTSKAIVVDATEAVTAVHQNHDYSHVPGGKAWSYEGEEAQENLRLAGPVPIGFGTSDATHRLTPRGLKLNLNRFGRILKRWRKRAGLRRSTLEKLTTLRSDP